MQFISLFDYLYHSFREYPKKVAVYARGEVFSYEYIYKKSMQLASGLHQLGVQKGERVVVSLGNRIEAIIAFWACHRIGACVCIISNEMSAEEVSYILHDSAAKVFLGDGDGDGDGDGVCVSECLNNVVDSNSIKIVYLSSIGKENPSLDSINNTLYCYSDLLNSDQLNCKYPISVDLAAIIYTSGSTGEPKGVMLSHQNMLVASQSIISYLNYHQNDVILCALPISFDYGLYQIIMGFSVSATVVLEEQPVLPTVILKRIRDYHCTVLPGVPNMFTMIEQLRQFGSIQPMDLRMITNTGATLTEKNISSLRKIFPGSEIFSMFGLTECKRCTYLPPDMIDAKPGSVGVAIPNTEITVIDENDIECPTGVIGELVVRGATVMQGYWQKPEQTANRLKPHPVYGDKCLFTGDFGYKDQDGFFYFTGRMDELMKINGQKVIPVQIENVISEFEGIDEVAVLSELDEQGESVVVAYMAGRIGEEDIPEIIRHCRENLTSVQIPEKVRILPNLPKNANGKIDKVAINRKLASIIL